MALPPPEVIAAAIQVAGQMGSKIGDKEYPVGTTYDDLQRALGFLRRKYGQASNIFQEGGIIGDYEFRGGGRDSAQENRSKNIRKAYEDYLLSEGFSEDYASSRAKRDKRLQKQKGFREYIKDTGDEYGLAAGKGRIKGVPTYEGFYFGPREGGRLYESNIDPEALLKTALGQRG